ncbi:hypothetical protein [Streptomyces collinus]|uniref:hypothetical protein n=1 Tax=Streptomyces collinus TaxID=42684 RepID=UPI00381820BC
MRFLVAALDGLIIQYEVHHYAEQSRGDMENVITVATALAPRRDKPRGVREPGGVARPTASADAWTGAGGTDEFRRPDRSTRTHAIEPPTGDPP